MTAVRSGIRYSEGKWRPVLKQQDQCQNSLSVSTYERPFGTYNYGTLRCVSSGYLGCD
jgi:hypothetical protein